MRSNWMEFGPIFFHGLSVVADKYICLFGSEVQSSRATMFS